MVTGNSAKARSVTTLLRSIESLLRGDNTTSTAALAEISELLSTLVDNTGVDGIYQGDIDGYDTGVLRLMQTDDDETSGVTYIGWSTYGNATSASGWLVEKITTTTVGSSEINTMTFSSGIWDDRATLTYV